MKRFGSRPAGVAAAIACVAALAAPAARAVPPSAEDAFYRIVTLPVPDGIVIEGGGIDILPDGRLAVATRYGEIWLVSGAFDLPPEHVRYDLFAGGLHEVLGLARRGRWLYATQRCEVTRIGDTDGDGRADVFDTVSDGWGLSGDYHEYAFGSKFDANGDMWVALCLTGSFTSNCLFRGWILRISADGTTKRVASGVRSPGGVGFNAEGEVFYTDNQGPWNGTCSLRHINPGAFMGHPASLKWYPEAPEMGSPPAVPRSGSRIHIEKERIPELMTPAVLFPYRKMGQSASGIECDRSGGAFGPFEGQLFVCDQTHSTVMRVFLEKVAGEYQGACFPFRLGFASGNIAIFQAPDGSMFVSGSSRGWGSLGGRPFALERLVWTGRTPFEVREMRVRPDGFELAFTEPVDAESAGRIDSYRLQTYTYIYQESYGSPEVDHTHPTIQKATVSPDRLRVRLRVDGLTIGHVHELHLPGVRSASGQPLLHSVAYYTLFRLPRAPGSGAASAGARDPRRRP